MITVSVAPECTRNLIGICFLPIVDHYFVWNTGKIGLRTVHVVSYALKRSLSSDFQNSVYSLGLGCTCTLARLGGPEGYYVGVGLA